MTPGAALAWVLVLVPCYFVLVILVTTKEYQPMSDRLSRAVRTFVQAFLATGIPLVAAKLAEVKGLSDLSGLVSGLAPVVSAALAAAISAVMFVVVPPAPKP